MDDEGIGNLGKDSSVGLCNQERLVELGLTIAALRKRRGLSQEALADRARISRSHLSAIESPHITRPFSVEVLFYLADALNVHPGDLLFSRLL